MLDQPGSSAASGARSAAGFHSRYTARRWIYRSVAGDPEGCAAALGQYLRANPHDLVRPLYEEAFVISKHAGRAPRGLYTRLALLPAGIGVTYFLYVYQLYERR